MAETFEERYAKFAAGAKRQQTPEEALRDVQEALPRAERAQRLPPSEVVQRIAAGPGPHPRLDEQDAAHLAREQAKRKHTLEAAESRSKLLDTATRRQIEAFVKSSDLPALFNFVERLLKYDRKLPTLLNADAFRDEVEKLYRRHFRSPGSRSQRASDTQPGVPLHAEPGQETLAGMPHLSRLGFFFIDLDDFKKLNDTRGHLAGDAALHAVARVLNESLRELDLKGRFGGEELVVAAELENDGDEFIVAEKLRRAIEAAEVTYQDQSFHVTASIGTAELQPGEAYDDLLDRANWAMKYAKTHGKNTVVPWEVPNVQEWVAAEKAKGKRS